MKKGTGIAAHIRLQSSVMTAAELATMKDSKAVVVDFDREPKEEGIKANYKITASPLTLNPIFEPKSGQELRRERRKNKRKKL